MAIKKMACGFWLGQSQGQSRSAAVDAEMRLKINARPRHSRGFDESTDALSEKRIVFCSMMPLWDAVPGVDRGTGGSRSSLPFLSMLANLARFFHKNLSLDGLTAIQLIQQQKESSCCGEPAGLLLITCGLL